MERPILKFNEYAVLMADIYTGIILNTNFEFHNNEINESCFKIFCDLESAELFVRETISSGKKVEIVIYNYSYDIVNIVSAIV
jgi:hypothetical protein